MQQERIRLRALEPGDLPRTLRWHNDVALYEQLGGMFRFVSRAAEREWLRARCRGQGDELALALCLRRGGTHIGNVYLRNIDWVARRAEVHIFIGAVRHRGKGYGTSALRQIVAHAFDRLGLQRLYLYVLAENTAAIRTYAHGGFQVEGRLRRHAYKDGRFKDMLVMGLCRPRA
jgi:RimJ/RimL family protein N-acetyltransferase